MEKEKIKSPLLGYNTNIRHSGHLFHIQTEDSGVGHPHIITHLFTEGTILSSKKSPYDDKLDKPNWEDLVRQMMKDQHKLMFVELRDGKHDEITEKILGRTLEQMKSDAPRRSQAGFTIQGDEDNEEEKSSSVASVAPAPMQAKSDAPIIDTANTQGMSIFETPNANGAFGETLISDKSLDEVILNYLSDDLD